MRSISWPRRSCAPRRHGAETVWPYYYAGTMGLVMRDGINRLRHVKKYSGFHSTICVNPAWTGFVAGTGRLAGPDPREMAKSDLVVIWGTNAVNTQVNVMTHAVRARKERGAKIVAIDVYMNGTMQQADLPVLIRPGHRRRACLRGDALPVSRRLCGLGISGKIHRRAARTGSSICARATPEWAARITGCPVETIEAFARAGRRAQARLFPPRLRLLALAQRRRQHACRELHRGGARRLAATKAAAPSTTTARSITGTRRMTEGLDARRPLDPPARSVAHRRRSSAASPTRSMAARR